MIVRETRRGLASFFHVKCPCGMIKMIRTGKFHGDVPDVNSKASIAVSHAGIADRQFQAVLAVLEIPAPTHRTLLKRAKEVQSHMEAVALSSCDDALLQECPDAETSNSTVDNCIKVPDASPQHEDKNLAESVRINDASPQHDDNHLMEPAMTTNACPQPDNNNVMGSIRITDDPNQPVDNQVVDSVRVTDASSQPECRDSRDYESTHLITSCDARRGGSHIDTMRKGIFKYDMAWQRRGSGRNYSSKSGVGTLIGNKTGKIVAYGVRIAECRVCDSNIRVGKTPPVHECHKNWSGSSKAMEADVATSLVKTVKTKGVTVSKIIMDDDTTTMAQLRKDHRRDIEKIRDINHSVKNVTNALYKVKERHRSLKKTTIKYLTSCFSKAIAQNEGDPDGMKKAVNQIVPHAFGEHDECGKWCGHHTLGTNYRHSTLSRDLTGDALRRDLESVFRVQANDAEKLAPRGSTNQVESVNSMHASKAPKRCHFAASGNLKRRIACSVAEKNMGSSYVTKMNVESGLSPGKICMAEGIRRDSERKRHLHYKNSVPVKRRRLEMKMSQRRLQLKREESEGITYESGVSVKEPGQLKEIPAAVCTPESVTITNRDVSLVFFYMETSSLYKDAEILEMAASCDGEMFTVYVTPTRPVAPSASKKTGLFSRGGVLNFFAVMNLCSLYPSKQLLCISFPGCKVARQLFWWDTI